MNVQDIVTRVRRTFGDEAAVQVTDDDIFRWITDGQIEIVKQNEGALQVTDFINLVANQSTYVLPADLFILRTVRYKYNSMLSFVTIKYKNMQDFDASIEGWDGSAFAAASPVFFTKYGTDIVLFPTPDQSATDGLKILYNKQPASVAALADPLTLPLVYHTTLVKYCMWQASMLDEDHEPGVMHQGNFQQDIEILATREASDPTDYYPTITVLADDQW